jgi:hypothetical protein
MEDEMGGAGNMHERRSSSNQNFSWKTVMEGWTARPRSGWNDNIIMGLREMWFEIMINLTASDVGEVLGILNWQ